MKCAVESCDFRLPAHRHRAVEMMYLDPDDPPDGVPERKFPAWVCFDCYQAARTADDEQSLREMRGFDGTETE